MKMSEMVLMDVNKDLETKEQELKSCGMFDVIDKHILKQEIRDLRTHKRALIKSRLSERGE